MTLITSRAGTLLLGQIGPLLTSILVAMWLLLPPTAYIIAYSKGYRMGVALMWAVLTFLLPLLILVPILLPEVSED